jgi:hypothetical protein
LLAVCKERLFVHDKLLFATPFQLILDVILDVLHNSKNQGEKISCEDNHRGNSELLGIGKSELKCNVKVECWGRRVPKIRHISSTTLNNLSQQLLFDFS